MMFDFDAEPQICSRCGKRRGDHKAITLNCPTGIKSRIGWLSWDKGQVFKEKRRRTTSSESKEG